MSCGLCPASTRIAGGWGRQSDSHMMVWSSTPSLGARSLFLLGIMAPWFPPPQGHSQTSPWANQHRLLACADQRDPHGWRLPGRSAFSRHSTLVFGRLRVVRGLWPGVLGLFWNGRAGFSRLVHRFSCHPGFYPAGPGFFVSYVLSIYIGFVREVPHDYRRNTFLFLIYTKGKSSSSSSSPTWAGGIFSDDLWDITGNGIP